MPASRALEMREAIGNIATPHQRFQFTQDEVRQAVLTLLSLLDQLGQVLLDHLVHDSVRCLSGTIHLWRNGCDHGQAVVQAPGRRGCRPSRIDFSGLERRLAIRLSRCRELGHVSCTWYSPNPVSTAMATAPAQTWSDVWDWIRAR